MLDALPFTVDTWKPDPRPKLQFLTHAHKDHCVGIEACGRRIVCTALSKDLVSESIVMPRQAIM